MKGRIFLIPTYLSDQNDLNFLAPSVLEVIKHTEYFLVENVRTARRFISSLNLGLDISTLQFELLDKKAKSRDLDELMAPVLEGKNLGVISESGLPGLADPGNLAVAYAHRHNLKVVPLPGASSIQIALIASGFNGQQFTFHGYLPIEKSARIKAIGDLEKEFHKTGFTQIFMETPFRNMSLVEDLLKTLNAETLLHISADLFGSKNLTLSQPVKSWKKRKFDIHKIPAVFCIGRFPQ